MTSQETSQEVSPGETPHVGTGTGPTANSSPKATCLEAPSSHISYAPETSEPQHTKLHLDAEPLAMISVTETGQSDSINSAPETDTQDNIFAVSMPVAVPLIDAPHRPSSSLLQTSDESDGMTVEGSPNERNNETSSELDDILSSPHGKNAIVERSPGGRYVRFMEKLGSGASKDVYRAYDTQEGIEVAWNVVHLAGVPKNERIRIVNEVRLLETSSPQHYQLSRILGQPRETTGQLCHGNSFFWDPAVFYKQGPGHSVEDRQTMGPSNLEGPRIPTFSRSSSDTSGSQMRKYIYQWYEW